MVDYNSDSDDSYNSDDWDNDGEAESLSAPALRSPNTPGPSTLVPQISIRDNSDTDEFDWDDDDDEAGLSSSPAPRNRDAPGPSTWVRQGAGGSANGAASLSCSIDDYVAMGFSKELVLKGIKNIFKTSGNSDGDPNQLLELLLALKELGDDSLVENRSTSGCTPKIVENEVDSEGWDDENDFFERDLSSHGSKVEDFLQDMSLRDKKIRYLLQMGFPEDEAKMAITRCGLDSAMSVLVDSIHASQAIGDEHETRNNNCIDSSMERKKGKLMEDCKKRKRFERGGESQPSWYQNHDDLMRVPSHMKRFNLPNTVNRRIPKEAIGPPFFYYEDVGFAPEAIWNKISTCLDNIVLEFFDSKCMSAAARERGFAHNLPIENRSTLLPLPPKTIFGVFPHTKACWPSWDKRTQLNSLQSCKARPKLLKHIQHLLARYDDIPPLGVQQYVMEECRKWNLIWVGKNRVASLEPHDMEHLLGFPRNYTRGVTTTDRYKSLGDAVQIDTVAYHFSVLKDMFPTGINVLSMYNGIGGSVVALDRLGIQLKTVVSVQTSEVSRNIFRSWWRATQSGTLVQINKMQDLSNDAVISLIKKYGDFDLVVGGNTCNNLPGSGEYDPKQFSLFLEYVRILKAVRSAKGSGC